MRRMAPWCAKQRAHGRWWRTSSTHSIADAGNEALLAFGSRRSQKAPTPEHPFGYGRERYFWAFVVALVLFVVGLLSGRSSLA